MKKMFAGYYRPSQAEFRKLWESCVFVPDANVLLNLYRYSTETREKLLDILKRIESRVWVPHQAALEYHRNRLEVISEQGGAYKQIEILLQETQKKLVGDLKTYSRHPLIDADKLLIHISAAFASQSKELQKIRELHPNLLENDDVLVVVTNLLSGRVGAPYPAARLEEIYKEGQDRYIKAVPPGFKDAKTKAGDRMFGDLVLWYQVIDMARAESKSVILITNEAKEDWWWKHEGKIVGPKPELIEEMQAKAGVGLYMYRPDQFMEYAREYLNQTVDQRAIDEVRKIRLSEERRQWQVSKLLDEAEHRVSRLMDECSAVESELASTTMQLGSLDRELHEMRLLPEDPNSAQERARLSTLAAHVEKMESLRRLLEIKRHELEERLIVEKSRRNILVHERVSRRQRPTEREERFLRSPADVLYEAIVPTRDPVKEGHASGKRLARGDKRES